MAAPLPAPPAYAVGPFVLLLGVIALAPLAAPHWWERNRNKLLVALALGLPVGGYYLARDPGALVHQLGDYVSFLLLLAALYVIAGGIRLTGDLVATPLVNATFLAGGALLASVIGTTGASMLLVRPLLESNRERARVTHTVVFFIFLVANIGGCLTPLGDPPLLLGYLAGVPFWWTLRLWPEWATGCVLLLAVYFVWDSIAHGREPLRRIAADRAARRPLRVTGLVNAPWLGGVVAAVALLRAPWREAAVAALTGLSLLTTPRGLRRASRFTMHPMAEVAALFLGIFLTMLPALDLLRSRGDALGVREPWQFFWATGLLSAVLDNAPTYLVFLALGQGLGLAPEVAGVPHRLLAAVSVGAVFMGAATYIGNAPNFMVKAIAEQARVRMPGFLGYTLYSGAVLLPLCGLLTLLFFRSG